tara:strand:- start:21751 stop:22110 length:360 start_codon:yes stop_codon:yes gene_type:complete
MSWGLTLDFLISLPLATCVELSNLANIGNNCHVEQEIEVTMATMNVSLPEPLKEWVETQAKSGRYSNTSDYVRDLIRKEQDRAERIENMQRLIDEGLESGEGSQSMEDLRNRAMELAKG